MKKYPFSLLWFYRLVSGDSLDRAPFPAPGRCVHERDYLSSYVSHLWLCIPDSACIQKAEKPSGTSARLPLYCRILPGRIYQRFYPAGFSHVPWDYSGVPHQYKGIIRLDYLPVWFLTGLFFEKILTKSS